MILGIGTDIVEIKHFKERLEKTPSIIKRLFTEKELKKASTLPPARKISYYAKRFCGKEAVSKACGTGIGVNIGWQDIEILNNKSGAPVVKLSEKSAHFLQKKYKVPKTEILISLSDEKNFAVAVALLKEKK